MTGAVRRTKPIAGQVRMMKAAFATTSTAARLAAARRRLAYHSSAKAAVVATIRMTDLLFVTVMLGAKPPMRGARRRAKGAA
jgi:hypothetical protein